MLCYITMPRRLFIFKAGLSEDRLLYGLMAQGLKVADIGSVGKARGGGHATAISRWRRVRE